jgi:hypothetical protein
MVMVFDLGFLLDTGSAAEFSALFPFQPIEWVLQVRSIAKRAARMLILREFSILHSLDSQVDSFVTIYDLFDQLLAHLISVD